MATRVSRHKRTPRVRPARRDAWVPPIALDKLKALEALVLDCDGVLTKNELFYDEDGKRSLVFNARDGAGLAFLCRSGFKVCVLSGRPVDIAEKRHKELGILHFVGKCPDKAQGLVDLCEKMGVNPLHCAFVGDDLPDMPAFRVAGVKIAVADAVPELASRADWVTTQKGGDGAVREVCEAIMRARGSWAELLKRLG